MLHSAAEIGARSVAILGLARLGQLVEIYGAGLRVSRYFYRAVAVVLVQTAVDTFFGLLLGHFHSSAHEEFVGVPVGRWRIAFVAELVEIGTALGFLEHLLVVGEKLILLLHSAAQ